MQPYVCGNKNTHTHIAKAMNTYFLFLLDEEPVISANFGTINKKISFVVELLSAFVYTADPNTVFSVHLHVIKAS